MKTLVADKLPAECLSALRALGCEVRAEADASAADLPRLVGDAGLLIVRSTEVSAATIEAGGHLKLILRAGAGVNTIALDTASRLGVFVSNCPGKNSIAVAELAMGLLLAVDRRIADSTADLRAGRWNKKRYGTGRGLHGRTLGVLGLGAISLEVVARARAFGMQCLVWSRSLTAERADGLGVRRAATPLDVARGADFVTVHLPLKPETRHIVGAEFLAAMRDGAALIHTARGGVVDDEALAAEAGKGRLLAGLDVYEGEPEAGAGPYDGAIGRLAGVTGTHHTGASTDQAQEAVADEVVRIVKVFMATGEPPHVVNVARDTPARWQLTVRHLDQVGVLAGLLDGLKQEGVNVQAVRNTIFDGARAASASLQLDTRPSDAMLEALRGQDARILHLDVRSLK